MIVERLLVRFTSTMRTGRLDLDLLDRDGGFIERNVLSSRVVGGDLDAAYQEGLVGDVADLQVVGSRGTLRMLYAPWRSVNAPSFVPTTTIVTPGTGFLFLSRPEPVILPVVPRQRAGQGTAGAEATRTVHVLICARPTLLSIQDRRLLHAGSLLRTRTGRPF